MKAVVRERYGSPEIMQLRDVPAPVAGPGHVLVRVRATSVNAADWRLLEGKPFLVRLDEGFRRPKQTILGADIAGTVESVGPGVKTFQPGDRVLGDLAEAGFGGFAGYAATPISRLAAIPDGVSFEEAAALPMAGVTALQALRDVANIQPGQKVLINGAAGGVGTFAVQLARLLGAEVTAVCSARNAEQARTLGAHHVLDYAKEDFVARPERYHAVLGVNGSRSLRDYRRALVPGGVYVMAGGGNRQLFEAIFLGSLTSRFSDKPARVCSANVSPADLIYLAQLIADKQLVAVIDRVYQLDETAEAVRYVASGHARGKVVVRQEAEL